MNLLRDERLLALHDLVAACRASASHCAQAAELLTGDARADELEALARQRSDLADFFGERMIAEDDIPEGPPEERSLLQSALASAKAAFADDGGSALLESCRAREQDVLNSAEAAMKSDLGEAEIAAAEALAKDARHRLETLLRIQP